MEYGVYTGKTGTRKANYANIYTYIYISEISIDMNRECARSIKLIPFRKITAYFESCQEIALQIQVGSDRGTKALHERRCSFHQLFLKLVISQVLCTQGHCSIDVHYHNYAACCKFIFPHKFIGIGDTILHHYVTNPTLKLLTVQDRGTKALHERRCSFHQLFLKLVISQVLCTHAVLTSIIIIMQLAANLFFRTNLLALVTQFCIIT